MEQPMISKEERVELAHELLDFGELFLCSGAEVYRVEDTLTRIGHRYHAYRMNVFASPASMVVTMIFPDDSDMTCSRRILQATGAPDYETLEELNQLSRDCCENGISFSEFRERFRRIKQKSRSQKICYFGAALAAGSFAVFFGGTIPDGLIAAGLGIFIFFLMRTLGKICPNNVAFNLISAFFVGMAAECLTFAIPILHLDKILIGDIMLLIPGVAMTNSIRDILVGDTITGISRLIESLIWALALACGFVLAMWIRRTVF